MPIDIPGVSALARCPGVWALPRKCSSRHSILTYVAIALVPLTAWALVAHALRPAAPCRR